MESACLLHAATGNGRYLEAGRLMQRSLVDRASAACGFASIADVESGGASICVCGWECVRGCMRACVRVCDCVCVCVCVRVRAFMSAHVYIYGLASGSG